MRAAFYAPLKSPNHPVVSGDREVARLIMRALCLNGYTVEVASELRVFLRESKESALDAHMDAARREADRLSAAWRQTRAPDLWVTYHPYYKSPDLIGPDLATTLGIPYVTIEASHSQRRNIGGWAKAQEIVARSVKTANLNMCLTRRDHDGLLTSFPQAKLALLPPFIDTGPYEFGRADRERACLFAVVAMMRRGDKFESYGMLAKALALLHDIPWSLDVVGDGPCRAETTALFEALPRDRIRWLGVLERPEVARVLQESSVYVWPGCGEAFGLAYLEAQASGLPVVAQRTAGVPEVVRHEETGLLTDEGDVEAYAAALRRLAQDTALRRRMGAEAARYVRSRHSLEAGARNLSGLLGPIIEQKYD